jgi:hypothetical protein
MIFNLYGGYYTSHDKTIKPITTDFGDQESRIGFGGIVADGKESFSLVLIARNNGMFTESECGSGAFHSGCNKSLNEGKGYSPLTDSPYKQTRLIGLDVYGVI